MEMMAHSGQETNGTLLRQRIGKEKEESLEIAQKEVAKPVEAAEETQSVEGSNCDRNGKENGNNQTDNEYNKEIQLLQWEDMPRHLQFNPYVKTGYRPLLSAWGCIHSLFYLHNETVNILTHGEYFYYVIVTWSNSSPLSCNTRSDDVSTVVPLNIGVRSNMS